MLGSAVACAAVKPDNFRVTSWENVFTGVFGVGTGAVGDSVGRAVGRKKQDELPATLVLPVKQLVHVREFALEE